VQVVRDSSLFYTIEFLDLNRDKKPKEKLYFGTIGHDTTEYQLQRNFV
jgi:hypothetical protein